MSCATPIPPSGPLGHVPEMTGHVAEIAGHDPETVGHVRPKYALGKLDGSTTG
ncbi:putative integral membrane protein [Burkholderia multivorans CGD2M]|uniref:Putative integral membrane protein n=1 Tax=Burkholderia multivorans CGD2 TaxID=513052 RepID=B9BK47_9BURK|nr:putative integral membrane protein [Burkholderia multivorans CGD2]EEE16001.1 putative integral membrane protein [Burkholderia multivorans CGD2M]